MITSNGIYTKIREPQIAMAHSGKFKPKHPQKYKGSPSNIVYRSSWEAKFMRYLDLHPDVIQWNSEEVIIPYRSPIDGRIHRYFPDFWVKKKSKAGEITTSLIEIKPKHQTIAPDKTKGMTKTGKPTKRYINEVFTYGVNMAKWEAAEAYCKDKGWVWQIFTETELF